MTNENNSQIEILTAALSSANKQIQRESIDKLGELGAFKAAKPLISILKDQNENWRVRSNCVYTLSLLAKNDTEGIITQALIETLEDKDNDVVLSVLSALTRIGKAAVLSLIEALEHQNFVVRYRASEILGEIGDRRAVKPLTKTLTDNHPLVRRKACLALVKLDGNETLDSFLRALRDEDSGVRAYAVLGLGKFNEPRIIDLLISASDEPNPEIRVNAINSLVELKTIEALPRLKQIRDENKEFGEVEQKVREVAKEAIRLIEIK